MLFSGCIKILPKTIAVYNCEKKKKIFSDRCLIIVLRSCIWDSSMQKCAILCNRSCNRWKFYLECHCLLLVWGHKKSTQFQIMPESWAFCCSTFGLKTRRGITEEKDGNFGVTEIIKFTMKEKRNKWLAGRRKNICFVFPLLQTSYWFNYSPLLTCFMTQGIWLHQRDQLHAEIDCSGHQL